MSKLKLVQVQLNVELSDEQQLAIENAILPLLKFNPENLSEQVAEIKAAIFDKNVKNSYEDFQNLFHNPTLIIKNDGRIEIHNVHEYILRCVNAEIKKTAKSSGQSFEELNWKASEVLTKAEKPTSKWDHLRERSRTSPAIARRNQLQNTIKPNKLENILENDKRESSDKDAFFRQ